MVGGRKINYEFEAAVLDSVIFSALEKESGRTAARLVVLANVCLSNGIIQKAEAIENQELHFKDDPLMNKLKFTRSWVARLAKQECPASPPHDTH